MVHWIFALAQDCRPARVAAMVVLGLDFLGAAPARAQNHPELHWRVVETEHFRLFYHQGLEEAVARAAQIAEEAYGPVTRLYGYEPEGRVRIVLKDYDDYANGAAFFYHDAIEIWTTALDHDFDLRGTTDWLRNVITHEFTHIISLGAARRAPQRMPALYLQWFGYQRERNRPDILVGYPDVLASYPVMNTSVPMWFAEGVAQYQATGARHDHWDSHRDMILRTAVLHDALLGFDEMGVFGKEGFGNEFVYDHGYALVRYIAATYGEEKLAEIARAAGHWKNAEIDAAIKEVLGLSAAQLYRAWRTQMQEHYQAQVEALGALREGQVIADQGFSNIWPALSPEGKRLAYLSTGKRQFGPHALVLRDLESGEEEVLAAGVAASALSWSPDGRRLLFVRKDKADRYGSRQADIYEYNLDGAQRSRKAKFLWALPVAVGARAPESPRIRRLTRGLRALYPAYAPGGEWIAFVHNEGTNNNMGLMKADGTQLRYLSDFADGTQLYTPRWSPDGRYLAFSISRGGRRDIGVLRVDTGAGPRLASIAPVDPPQPQPELEIVVSTEGTDRDPVWSADGGSLVFSSDFSGIFNLYSLELETRRVRQLTNVVGGAFTPSLGDSGQVAFAAYGAGGYQVRQVDYGEATPLPAGRLQPLFLQPRRLSVAPPATAPQVESRPYGIDFLKTSLMPRLLVDEGHFKGGFYLNSGDVLGKQNISAGVSFAPGNGDRDLFFIYEYRGKRPTLFFEFFQQRRHDARGDSTAARDLIVTGANFTLNQINIGLRAHPVRNSEVQASLTYDRSDASIQSDAFAPRADGRVGLERRKQKPLGYTFLNGFDLGLSYRYESVARRRDREINPRRGRRLYFRYDRMFNFFLKGFDQDASFLDEQFLHLFYNQFTLDWKEFVATPGGTTLGLRFYGGWIASDKVDDKKRINDFFDYHLGGLNFMKGYTFYSVEGRKAAMSTATLRFPIAPNVHKRFLHLYLDKIYGAVYGDVGKAWDGSFSDRDPIYGRKAPLRDLGGQLRFDMVSYYSVPTRVQLDLAYGVDEVKGRNPWKFYATILFGYL